MEPLEKDRIASRETEYKFPGENALYLLKEQKAPELAEKGSQTEFQFEEILEKEETKECEAEQSRGKQKTLAKQKAASALSPHAERKCEFSFCPPETFHALRQMFLVFEEKNICSFQPLEHKQVKELAEAVRIYGVEE